MTRDEIDKLWFQACKEAADAKEQFGRYRFAELIAAAQSKEDAKVADKYASIGAGFIADEIRARGEK